MPIRNPFARRTAVDEHPGLAGPNSSASDLPKSPSFERVDTVGSMASSSMSMRSRRSQDTGDYKMSVVNDSGVYLPPSPTSERDAFWSSSNGNGHRRTYITSLSTLSRSSTDNAGNSPTGAGRTSLGDIEPFSISRESFDSYRRSFDISAKSPITSSSEWTRQSLDSRRPTKPLNGSSMRQTRFPPADEGFEDVGLDDGRQQTASTHTTSVGASATNAASNFIKKRGAFFSKFGSDHTAENADNKFLSGRKRGQSGQGAELTPMDRNTSQAIDAIAAPAEPQPVK
ncbi:hypothetical protein SEUCBS139899_003220 [Sporothrix eucalyptigena]